MHIKACDTTTGDHKLELRLSILSSGQLLNATPHRADPGRPSRSNGTITILHGGRAEGKAMFKPPMSKLQRKQFLDPHASWTRGSIKILQSLYMSGMTCLSRSSSVALFLSRKSQFPRRTTNLAVSARFGKHRRTAWPFWPVA